MRSTGRNLARTELRGFFTFELVLKNAAELGRLVV